MSIQFGYKEEPLSIVTLYDGSLADPDTEEFKFALGHVTKRDNIFHKRDASERVDIHVVINTFKIRIGGDSAEWGPWWYPLSSGIQLNRIIDYVPGVYYVDVVQPENEAYQNQAYQAHT